MTRSPAAQAAALIRKELKTLGIKASVTSQNYSMGDNVRVEVTDLTPAAFKDLETRFAKYEYGHFDGMTDCYEYTNRRDDIPQTKYLFVTNTMSDAMRKQVYNHLRLTWAGGEALPAELPENYSSINFHGEWLDRFMWRMFTGAIDSFWAEGKAA